MYTFLLSHIETIKGSILWVIFNSSSHTEKKYNSLSHFKKFNSSSLNSLRQKINSFSRCFSRRKSSILWVTFNKRVQFFESYSEKGSILGVTFKKKGSILWVIWKNIQFFRSNWNKKRFNSLSHIDFFQSCWQKVQFFESYFFWKKSSILWFKNVSVLWVNTWQ